MRAHAHVQSGGAPVRYYPYTAEVTRTCSAANTQLEHNETFV